MTNFASSFSRNMDRLSLDSDHLMRQEVSRYHRQPNGLSDGLFNGLTGFGLSLLGQSSCSTYILFQIEASFNPMQERLRVWPTNRCKH